jgi:Na+-transporting methylmalonyl-CoA/oxaloacetate decarboxylase gamma subunit
MRLTPLNKLERIEMTLKGILITFTSVGIVPAALWALASIISRIGAYRRIWFSFSVYRKSDLAKVFEFNALPVFTSICILVGTALIIYGINSIPRSR